MRTIPETSAVPSASPSSAGNAPPSHELRQSLRATQSALRRSQRQLRVRNHIAEIFLTVPSEEMYGEVLHVVLKALASKYGVFGYIDEAGDLVCPSLTRDVWEECRVSDKMVVFRRGAWSGIWGEALRRQEVIRSNGPFTVPRGHIPIERAIAAPIVFRGDTIGVLHVANKATDYDEKDTRLLEVIAGHVAPILHARLQSDRQREELRQHSDHLEETVRKRTADLRSASKKLLKEVNERTRAEETLGESEQKYGRLVENLHEGIWATDKDARTTFVNSRMAAMLGYTCEEMLGRHIFAFMDEQGVEIARQGIERRRRGVAEQQDSVFLRKDGSRLRVTMAITPLVDANGQYAGGLAGMLDLTDRKAAEEALQQSESRFRQVLELSTDLIYRLDLKSRTYDYVSPSVLRLSGFTEKEFAALGIHGIRHRVHPEDWPEFKRKLEEALEPRSDDGEARGHEYRWQCKDGQYRWFHESVAFVRGDDERLLSMVGTVRDITERKQAEEALQESLRLLRDTGEMAKVGGWELDLSTKEVSWTEEVRRIHGVEPGHEPKLEEALSFYAPESRPAVEAAVKKAVETGEPYDLESLFIPLGSKDKIWVRSLGKAVYSGGKIVKLAGTFQNTDEYKRADEALRRSEETHRLLFETTVQGIVYQSADGAIISANPAAERILGLTIDQMRGRTSVDPRWKAIHEDGSDFPGETHPSMTALKTGREVLNVVMGVFNPKDDSHRWININAIPLFRPGEDRPHQVYTTFEDITERKQVEEALRDSETRYRELFSGINSGVAVYEACSDGEDFVFRDFNQAGERIDSVQKDVLLGRRVTEVFPGIREFGLLDVFRRVWRTGAPEHHPVSIYRDNRIVGWRENYVYKLPSGEIVALYEEITERKRAEEALRESESRFRQVLEVSSDLVYKLNLESGTFDYVSPSVEPLTGFTPEEVIAMGFRGIRLGIHPEDWPQYRREINDFVKIDSRDGASHRYKYRWRCKDGQYRWFEESRALVRGEDLPPLAVVGTIRDTTERHQAEEAVRESEERFRTLAASVPVGIFLTDAEGKIVYVNQTVLEITGLTALQETAGWRWGIDPHPDDREAVIAERTKAMAEGRAFLGDFRILTPQGVTRCVETRNSPLFDEKGEQIGRAGMVEDVTQRRRAEEALRESEARFRALYEQAPLGIALMDSHTGQFLQINAKFCEIVGRTQEEMLKLNFQSITHPDDLQLDLDNMKRLIEGQIRSFNMEKRYYRTDGSIVCVGLTVVPMWGESESPRYHIAMVEDITERKRGEETLRESENRFRQVLEASSDAICRVRVPSGVCEYVSPAVLPLTGFTQEEFAALGVYAYRHRIHPDDWPKYRQRVEKLVAGFEDETASRHEYRWLCKNGQYRWFADSVALVRDDDGRPLALVFTGRDTTERREAEEALRQSEVHFRELSASSPVGVFRSDAEGRAVYTNERLRQITGLTVEQNMGLGWTDVVHPDDREAMLAERSKAIASGQQYTLEFRLQTRHQGISWVRMHSRPILSTDGRQIGRVGTVEDITEHKEAEERERRLHEQQARTRELRAAVRALERMAATLAHELRNPLGVISNSAYFLCNQAGISDARALKHAQIIGREVKSARRAIDDILEFALTPQILLSPASLNVIVDQALARSQIPANIRVTRKPAPDLPPLVCDAERLERAFLDIIANAVQAMPHGGRLSARTQLAADGVTVVFSDTGEGIAPQNLAKVFDPMFTTKLRGIGLGLTVVRRTVEQHGGQVELKSELGRGTSVIMTLPPLDSASGNPVPADAPGSAA